MTDTSDAVKQAIQNASSALRTGNKRIARRWAECAVFLGGDQEESWLMLAQTASPHARIAYLEQALKINPNNKGIQKALSDAEQPVRLVTRQTCPGLKPASRNRFTSGGIVLDALGAILLVALASFIWFGGATMARTIIERAIEDFGHTPVNTSFNLNLPGSSLKVIFFPSSATPTVTDNRLSTPTLTQTPVSSSTPTAAMTSDSIVITTPTRTQPPTQVPTDAGLKSILVNVSQQHLYAFEGGKLVFSFVVSTGSNDSTRYGNYTIQDKQPDAYSSPYGFWMPDWMGIYWVGTAENGFHALPVLDDGEQLWGDQIGQPITYGCIVLEPGDMQQLYTWAKVGTAVQIEK